MHNTEPSPDLHAFQSACAAEKRPLAFRAQCVRVEQKETKDGKPFFTCEFADATGTMKLKAWSDNPSAGWCKAFAEALVHNGHSREAQLACEAERVSSTVQVTGTFSKGDFGVESNDWTTRPLTGDERAAFFLGSAELRAKQQRDYDDIVVFIQGMRDRHFQALCVRFLDERGTEFRRAAAARGHHHARPGGLVEHVAGMMRAAAALAAAYNVTLLSIQNPESKIQNSVNRDLLLAGVLFHDCGKLNENQYRPDSFDMPFTPIAELLGHIPIGTLLVDKLWGQCEQRDVSAKLKAQMQRDGKTSAADAEPWPTDKLLHLLHLIVSHHGTKEWGSPTEPKTYEAILLHYVDNTDAKMEMLRDGFATAARVAPGITNRVYPFGHGLVETPGWMSNEADTEANRASVQIYRQTIESLHFKSEGNCVMKQEEIAVTHFDDLRNEGATTPEAQP